MQTIETQELPTRTPAEVAARFKAREKADHFGFEVDVYLGYMEYADARPYMTKEARAEADSGEGWRYEPVLKSKILDDMLTYMEHAWDKANNRRGISAARSLQHYQAWLWLIGEDDLAEQIGTYEFYGKPQLIAICEKFGWDHTKWDDGVRTNR